MAKRHTHETVTDLKPEELYRAIIALQRWPEWDTELQLVEYDGKPLQVGSIFFLKPKGGPRTRMRVETVAPPRLFVDVAYLPLGRMRTSHEFLPVAKGTSVRTSIETTGPLAFLWDKVIASKQATGAAEQTARFLAFAAALA
jgi:hypothetical protein